MLSPAPGRATDAAPGKVRTGNRRGHEKHFGTGKEDTNVPDGHHSPHSPGHVQWPRPLCCRPAASCLQFLLMSMLLTPPWSSAASHTAFEVTGEPHEGGSSDGRLWASEGYLEHLLSKRNSCFCGQLHYACRHGHSCPLHSSYQVAWRGLFCGHLSFPSC